ncbi:MAG: hypothetical protein AAGE52_37930 [Myxococcota bacterium]
MKLSVAGRARYPFAVDDWVDEEEALSNPPLASGLTLSPEGASWSARPSHRAFATWDQVFGVALVPEDSPTRAFILVPRRPPKPPWFEIRTKDLPENLRDAGLKGLATQVTSRMQHRGYRDAGPKRPLLDAETLMQRVLARTEVPGALEVPVAAGPGGWWRRSLDLFAAGSAGGLAGLYAGAFSGSGLIAIGVAAAGVAVGASVPVFVASNWRSVRARTRKPRVLVLAPDGCVVGLPTGPEAFDWPSIRHFRAGEQVAAGRARPCLEVVRSDGRVAGRIDAAWFAQPLPLIVAVAEAYRARCMANQSIS